MVAVGYGFKSICRRKWQHLNLNFLLPLFLCFFLSQSLLNNVLCIVGYVSIELMFTRLVMMWNCGCLD